ncbi:hypothetical protein ACTFUJ_19625, partial [Proteus mirabilis]
MAFIPLRPIPIKDRHSMIFIGMGRIDVKDGAFVVIDEINGERMLIPVGSLALMNPLMILVKIIKLRWIHILSYDQMVSRKINNQTT